MFAIRRAALRALARPASQISIARPSPRFPLTQQFTPSLSESFHQSLRWLSEEDKSRSVQAEAQEAAEAVEKAEEVVEKEIATSDVADAANSGSTDALADATDKPRRKGEAFPGSENNSRIIYVGNLFFDVNVQQLESEFSKYGTVTNSRVVHDSEGRSKGFGFIEFATPEQAAEAIAGTDQKVFQGRRMAVQKHVPKPARAPRAPRNNGPLGSNSYTAREPSNTLFIGNMSFQMSDSDLNDLFRDVQNVVGVRVAIDRRTGQPRGFAHADFVDVDSATKAKEYLSRKTIYGRTLRVDYSAHTDRSSSAA